MSESIGRMFMRQTNSAFVGETAQAQGAPQPPLELPYDATQRLIALPEPRAADPVAAPLIDLIERRVTVRRYTGQPLTLAELSYLLWCTQGVKPLKMPDRTLRNVPSAGARHPFETLLLVNRVEDLAPGLYRYVASLHSLVPLRAEEPGLAGRVARACGNQSHVEQAAVDFIWVAVPERATWRYGERGYRYLHLDAGHVCQNLYLAAWSIGCGTCAIGAYDDHALNGVLELDGETQFVIYMGSVGKRPGA